MPWVSASRSAIRFTLHKRNIEKRSADSFFDLSTARSLEKLQYISWMLVQLIVNGSCSDLLGSDLNLTGNNITLFETLLSVKYKNVSPVFSGLILTNWKGETMTNIYLAKISGYVKTLWMARKSFLFSTTLRHEIAKYAHFRVALRISRQFSLTFMS